MVVNMVLMPSVPVWSEYADLGVKGCPKILTWHQVLNSYSFCLDTRKCHHSTLQKIDSKNLYKSEIQFKSKNLISNKIFNIINVFERFHHEWLEIFNIQKSKFFFLVSWTLICTVVLHTKLRFMRLFLVVTFW